MGQKNKRRLEAEKLQYELDRQHQIRDYYNTLFGTNYTTKQAVELHIKLRTQ